MSMTSTHAHLSPFGPDKYLTQYTAGQSALSTEQPKVFIIAGPGGKAGAFAALTDLADACRERGAVVTVFGDGISCQSLEDLRETWSSTMKDTDEVTVFLLGHGETIGGEHFLRFEHDAVDTSTQQLLRTLSAKTDDCRKRDVFLCSCHGRSALPYANNLPPGSTVASACGDETLYGFATSRFAEAIRESSLPLTAEGFMDAYLTRAMLNAQRPCMQRFGESENNLYDKFSHRFGRKFSETERQMITTKLGSQIDGTTLSRCFSAMQSWYGEGNVGMSLRGPCIAICKAVGDA